MLIQNLDMNVSKNKAFHFATTSQTATPKARTSLLSCGLLPPLLHFILLLLFCAGSDTQGARRRKTATMLYGRLPGQSGTAAIHCAHGRRCLPHTGTPSFLRLFPGAPSFRRQRNRQQLRMFTRLRLPRSRLASCRYRIFTIPHWQYAQYPIPARLQPTNLALKENYNTFHTSAVSACKPERHPREYTKLDTNSLKLTYLHDTPVSAMLS